jgi:hypothetical protein
MHDAGARWLVAPLKNQFQPLAGEQNFGLLVLLTSVVFPLRTSN